VNILPKPTKRIEGKVNKVIDELIHPYFQKYPATIIIDGLLHAIIEQNSNQSLKKFIKYNSYQLLKHLKKNKSR